MAEYITTDTELTNVANAIRSKGGTSASLVYPNGFVNAINDIDTGVDLSGDTVTPSDVLSGVSFHDRNGTQQTGNMITHNVYDGLDSTSTSDALSANQGKVLNSKMPKSVSFSGTSDSGGNFILSNVPTTATIIGVHSASALFVIPYKYSGGWALKVCKDQQNGNFIYVVKLPSTPIAGTVYYLD